MRAKKTKVGMVSLGCPKNLVDSEVMLGLLRREGYEITPDEREADVLIVNTCAFIGPAKKESVDAILDAARLKTSGSLEKLIVTGCLPQPYRSDLEKEMPEVDHFVGTGEFPRIAEFVRLEGSAERSAVARPEYLYDYATPRLSTLRRHTDHAEPATRTIEAS